MALYEVSTYYADTCGNVDYYHYGYFEANSDKEIFKVFPPKGFLCGWRVNKIKGNKLPKRAPKFPKEGEQYTPKLIDRIRRV